MLTKLRKLLRCARESKYIRNVGILVSGSLLSQIIIVGVSPILTRLYSPEEMGVFTYFLSIAAIFMGVICLRYDMSIVYERDGRNVFALIKLSVLIAIVLSAVIAIGFTAYFQFFSAKYHNGGILGIFLFFLLVSYGVINTLTAYNNRMEEYRTITRVYVIRTAFQNFGGLLLGLLSPISMSLIIPYAAGQFFGIRQQGKPLRGKWRDIFAIDSSELKRVAKLHRSQLFFSTPALFANSLSYSSITLFIEMLFDFTTVGFYSLSVRILGMPISLISGNIAKVYFKEAAEEHNRTRQFSHAYRKTLFIMLAVALPFVLLVIWLAPSLCRIVFGQSWEIAGEYMRILAPMFGARLVMTTLSPGLQICGQQRSEFLLQSLLLAASILSFALAKAMGWSVLSFLLAVNWSKFVVYILFLAVIGAYARGNRNKGEIVTL